MTVSAPPAPGAETAPAPPSALPGAALLDLIDAGARAGPLARAGLLYRAARPDDAAPDQVTIGDRDRAVWALRQAQFDRQAAEAVWGCTACEAEIEIILPPDFAPPPAPASTARLDWKGESWRIALPRQADLIEAERATGRSGGLALHRLAPDAPWSDEAFQRAAEQAIDAADPAIDMRLDAVCAACGAGLSRLFDPCAFVWAEFETAARELVDDVVLLARVFHWSESEILAMSPARRARYLGEARA